MQHTFKYQIYHRSKQPWVNIHFRLIISRHKLHIQHWFFWLHWNLLQSILSISTYTPLFHQIYYISQQDEKKCSWEFILFQTYSILKASHCLSTKKHCNKSWNTETQKHGLGLQEPTIPSAYFDWSIYILFTLLGLN